MQRKGETLGAGLKVYLVGGAVRDALLGLRVDERDWLVVGATPSEMLAMGFRPVGKDFPVFLHPSTREEYALARTERKTAPGYHGFEVHASPDVTVEQDLERRDLTINAMAQDEVGNLLDPFGGLEDLDKKRLRHVSPAFSEDPVRILRVARFAARFAHLGFTVATETLALMADMVTAGEVDALVPERVYREIEKALSEASPHIFFSVLRSCGALRRLLPEIDRLFGEPLDRDHYPESDTGHHVMKALGEAAKMRVSPATAFAVLVHHVGKVGTSNASCRGKESQEAPASRNLEEMAKRLRLPSHVLRLALKVSQYHDEVHAIETLSAARVLEVLERLDGFRSPDEFSEVMLACAADVRGREGQGLNPYPQAELWQRALEATGAVSPQVFLKRGLQGRDIGIALASARTEAIRIALKSVNG